MTAVIESVAQSMLYGVLYMISFVLLTFALHLLVRMLDAVLRLPGLHGLNAVGGGLWGLGGSPWWTGRGRSAAVPGGVGPAAGGRLL